MRAALAGLACCVMCGALFAQGVAPASSMPPEVRDARPELRAAGATRLRMWGFDIYDANLWVGAGFRAGRWSDQPFALELRYLRSFDGEDIAQRSIDEMRRGRPFGAEASRRWLDDMKAAFPNVRKGDRIVGVYEPGAGARFFHNGVPTREVKDTDFAERFFAIWLAPQTSEPAMREALLAPVAR